MEMILSVKLFTVLPPAPHHCHFPWFQLPSGTRSTEAQMIPLLTCQGISSSLTLCHTPHLISPHRHFIISRHHKKGEYSAVRCFEEDHIHITCITIDCYNYSKLLLFIVINLLLCLIYNLNFIIGV